MTKMLEATKTAITNALELEGKAPTDSKRTYFHGKAMGVLDLSANVLSKTEYWKVWEHYKIEKERLL